MRRNLPPLVSIVLSIICAVVFVGMPQIATFAAFPFFILVWGAMQRRGSVFEASLPIRGRDILAVRLIWILVLLWLPIAAWTYAAINGRAHEYPLSRVVDVGFLFTLAALLPYAIQPKRVDEPPFWITAALWIGLAGASAIIVYLLPADVALEALVIATVVVARVIWMRVPDALELAPREADVPRRATLTMRAPTSHALSRGQPWKPVLLSLFHGPRTSGGARSFLAFFMYAGMFMYGAGGRFQLNLLIYLTLPIVMAREATAWLAAFPISNRVRLWCVLVPGVVLSMGSYAAGRVTLPRLFHFPQSMRTGAPQSADDLYNLTRVPLEFWHRAPLGGDARIVAPWGETAIEDTFSILGQRLVNPYTTHPGSSAQYVEWQFRRATTAVYGHPMSIENYKRLEHDGTLPPDVLSSARMEILNVGSFTAIALLLVLLIEMACWHRIATNRARSFAVRSIAGFPVLLMVVNFIYGRYPASDVVTPIVERALLRASSALPSSLAVTALVAVLPVVAVYALLEWQIARSEWVGAKPSTTRLGRFLSRPVRGFQTS
jgi:hypothetical protein